MGGFHYKGDLEKNLGNSKLMSLESQYSSIKRAALDRASFEVCSPSKWLSDVSFSDEFMKKYRHHYIANGLDQNIFKEFDKDFSRDVYSLPKDKKIILFVSEVIENSKRDFLF